MRRHERRQAQRQARRTRGYMHAIANRSANLAPGHVYTVRVEHDDCCRIWKGGPCSCSPAVGHPQRWEEAHA
jgi:hypothetical protein